MGAIAWKFLPYLRPYRGRFAWTLIQVFLMAGFDLLKPWPLKLVIDDVLGAKADASLTPRGELLVLACLALVAVTIGSGLMALWHNYTSIGVGQRMVNDLRGRLYSHLQRLSLAFHSRQKVGDLMYRITSDSFAVQTMIMNGLLPILSALILLAGMLAILVPLDPLLTLLSLTIIPGLFAVIALFNRKIAEVATEVRERESTVYTLVHWAVSSVKLIQAFTKEDDEFRRFMGASRASLGATLSLY
ncbi:MAG TPA: ABC transporter transmembrane domain-containing protein, partial [Stellaceae bacterium]|nr:ABC transporter transmembrane domain-containing protein [Stellaceae bacterium]